MPHRVEPTNERLIHRIVCFLFQPIIEKLHLLMATVDQLNQALTDLSTALDSEFSKVISEVKALQDQIASADGKIDPASLDAVLLSLTSLKDKVAAFDPENPSSN